MNIAKSLLSFSVLALLGSGAVAVHAQELEHEVETLPTITLMADSELRDEVLTTVLPFQEDKDVRKALQHHVIKNEQAIQNAEIPSQLAPVNYTPQAKLPDMSHLTPLQREYVLSVASALQSSDPTSGIFLMLKPLGIDRDKALNNVSSGSTIQFNFDKQQLDQLLGDKWQQGIKLN